MSEAWSTFHLRFPSLRPPQSVTPDTAARVAAALEGHDERVLLLGVTPALTGIGQGLVAVDRSANMIANVWPGDDARRRVVEADWRAVEPGGDFSAVIGDGSFNCLAYPGDYAAVFARLGALLRPGARFVVRFFITPEPCESIAALADATRAGRVESIHALRWRLGMAACAERGDVNIPVTRIYGLFARLFPDRTLLAQQTGWAPDQIATIDFYRDSPDVISFPTLTQIQAVIPAGFTAVRLIGSGAYDLAERCPLVVMDWAGQSSDPPVYQFQRS